MHVHVFEGVRSASTCTHGHLKAGDHPQWSNFLSSMLFEKGILIGLEFIKKVRLVSQEARGICPCFKRVHPCLAACCCSNMGPGELNSGPYAHKANTLLTEPSLRASHLLPIISFPHIPTTLNSGACLSQTKKSAIT